MKKTDSFSFGVVLLTLSAIIVKLIGVCYKIPLMHILGAQGMGYFNTAYDVYALLCIVSTTGLPVAVSVIMNQNMGQHKRVFRLSLFVFFLLGIVGAVAVFMWAETIADAIGAPLAVKSLKCIAPAIFFISLSGAYRGFYQAKCNMIPTAISQVVEAACKLIFGLIFAQIAIKRNLPIEYIAAYAVFGLTIGTGFCLFYLILCKKRELNSSIEAKPYSSILYALAKIALPVTLGALLSGASKTIDLALIMRRLQLSGVQQQDTVALYGCYTTMVIPLFGAIPALFGSIAMSIVPHLSYAIRSSDRQEQMQIIQSAIRLTAIFSIPSALGLGLLAKPVLSLLFALTDDTQIAVHLLTIVCIAIPASCMITVTSAILQAYNKSWVPMLATVIGCIIKAVLLYFLAASPDIGIAAAPISTLVCCCVTVCINLFCIEKYAPPFHFSRSWGESVISAILSVGVAALTYRYASQMVRSNALMIVLCICIAIPIYFITSLKLGLITTSDIKTLIKKDTK